MTKLSKEQTKIQKCAFIIWCPFLFSKVALFLPCDVFRLPDWLPLWLSCRWQPPTAPGQVSNPCSKITGLRCAVQLPVSMILFCAFLCFLYVFVGFVCFSLVFCWFCAEWHRSLFVSSAATWCPDNSEATDSTHCIMNCTCADNTNHHHSLKNKKQKLLQP